MDRMWTVFASCLLVGMIVMLTLNVDLIRENVIFDAKEIISSVLQRSKRATSDKPARVFGKCGGEQYGRTGWIATPNFPGSSYPALSKCNWTITVYPRMVIKFEFEYMDLEEAPVQKRGSCQADYLELREGRKSTDPLVGGQKYCGKTTKFNPVYSTTSKVYAYFHSDARDEGEGFAVKWTASDPPADAFNCDFEDINDMCIGWEQSKNDKFDWALHHGRTQSGLTTETGPIKDHTTDSDLGFYAYIEASGQRNGDKAVLISPKVRIHHPAGHCFRFWYHMRGTSMGTLNVYQQEVVPGMNTTAELIFNRTGNLGLNWRRAAINITKSAAKRIRFLFEGVRGSSFRGDMAIDDISISKGPCPAPIVTTTTTTTTTATTTTAKTRKPKKTPKPTRKTTTKPPPPPLTTPRTTPAEKCAGMYTCSEVGNCVEFQYFCDGLQDCLHKDDEKDCGDEDGTSTAKPSITKWDPWSSWSVCTKSCGAGTTERSRKCDNGIVDSVLGCIGTAIEAMECNTHKCMQWAAWQKWTDCSATCGEGVRTRDRICLGGNPGERGCIGPTVQVDFCNEHNCPQWGKWSKWGPCEGTCKQGTTVKSRTCEGGQIGDKGCTGKATKTKECLREDLPSCGAEWADWQPWTDCSTTCNNGIRIRHRTCDGAEPGEQGCIGPTIEEDSCNAHPCPSWEPWSQWGPCESTCKNGTSLRSRSCKGGQVGDIGCQGDANEERNCIRDDLLPCPEWTPWQSWMDCTTTCGGGMHARSRICLGEEPGDRGCIGDNTEAGVCNEHNCPKWGEWAEWGSCEATCEKGTSVRRRTCDGGQIGDNGCNGDATETKDCVRDDLPPCAEWADWQPWKHCSVTCGGGIKMRDRTCDGAEPGKQGCLGPSIGVDVCNTHSCPRWEQWGAWGVCEASCKKGASVRTRICKGGQIGDQGCEGDATETKDCIRDDLPPCTGWTEWSTFGECTVTCGGGLMTKTRQCIKDDADPIACEGDGYEMKECGTDACPALKPMWTTWGNWSECSLSCGGGYTGRRRQCLVGDVESKRCRGRKVNSRVCNRIKCPRWREWNHWQSCSRSCGGGTQERRRSCDGGPPNTPGCMGDEMETQNCNQQSCETTTQQTQTTTTPSTTQQSRTRWGEWGRWGVCSTSCDKGIQLRSRECIGGKAGRRGCRGSKVEKQDCNERRCEVVTEAKTTTQAPQSGPVWGEWSDWEQCSATCGPGTTSRSRTCIGAKRRRRCKGQKSDTRSCAVKACEDTGPDKPDAACLQRNVRLARRKGRKCPIGCSSDGECGQGKQCVCDGLCGKTCQEKDKKCRNILSSTPEGTVLSCSNGIFVGSKCTYSCKDGYELQGNADIFCQGTSKWTNEKSMPKCIGTTDRSSTGTTSAEQSCKFKVRAHDSCCGKVSYFSKKARCCSGKAKPAGPAMTECCFQTPYDPLKKGCCGKRLFPLSNKKCKDGKIVNK